MSGGNPILINGHPFGENLFEELTDEQFAASLDAWRDRQCLTVDYNLAIRYLNEAERRWRP